MAKRMSGGDRTLAAVPSAGRVLVPGERAAPDRDDPSAQPALLLLAPRVQALRPPEPEAATRLVDVAVERHGRLVHLDCVADSGAPSAGVVEPATGSDRTGHLAGAEVGGVLDQEAGVDGSVLRRRVEVEDASGEVGNPGDLVAD